WQLDRDIRMHERNNAGAVADSSSAARLSLISEMHTPPPVRSTRETIATVNGEEGAAGQGAPSELVKELPAIHPAGIRAGQERSLCLTFGPLPEETQATGLDDWFRSRHAGTRVRSTNSRNRQFFWIYLAPQESRKGAMELLQDLQKKGVSDYRLVRRGKLENAVSLGVFSSQSAVNDRLAELQNKGYKPVVVPYSGVNRVYWLDVKLDSFAGDMQEVFKGYPARFNSVPVSCDKIDIADMEP
ncbi:MAG: SPOR domain-containing protein, partial [Gammaproteobacteria bacterium]